jgi:8-hydroxy-5-deazaflavin:NADPH oxidoreductase
MNARIVLRALACAAFLCVSASASAADITKSEAPMKIGIVGTGNIGGALATHWAKAGHELVISSRHPEELQDLAKSLGPKVRVGTPLEAAQFGDVILLSVPYKATPQVGKDLASAWQGKIVLDTGNPYPFRDGAMAEDARKRGTGVTSKEFLPGVRLVRAFNAINAGNLARDGNREPERLAIPLASDDAGALEVTQRLVRDAGFDPVVVGGLARAREFDVGTKVYTRLLTAKQLREELGLKEP